MKKTRLIALTLVVALMLMGAGYAFWQESMTINAAVETGELDFAFRKASFSGGEYVKGSAKVDKEDDNILHLEFKNMHPSAYATVGFRMVNTGTIGLKVEDFVFEGDDSNLAQLLVSEVNGEKVGKTVEEYFSGLTDLSIPIEKGEYKDYTLKFAVKPCANDDNFKELTNFSFSIKAIVKQYNDNGSCNNEEPEPEITDWEICPLEQFNRYDKKYVKGPAYYIFDDGSKIYAGQVPPDGIGEFGGWFALEKNVERVIEFEGGPKLYFKWVFNSIFDNYIDFYLK